MSETYQEFAVTLRGYDPAQVDEHVGRLQGLLADAEERARRAESARDGDGEYGRVGEQVEALLRTAADAAARVRHDAEEEARAVLGRANGQADEVVRAATAEADRVTADTQQARGEAEAVRQQAHRDAEALLQNARRHAEDQARAIVVRAEEDADRVLDEAERIARARLDDIEARYREREALVADFAARHRTVVDDLAQLLAALGPDAESASPPRDTGATRAP